MSQHDFDIADASGALVRADLNNAFKALATLSSGTTAPSTTYPYQLWMDTSGTPALLKQRDGANSAWVTIGAVGSSALWSAYTNNVERIRIDNTGKVGIGITSPAYALDVSGDINCTGNLRVNGAPVGTIADGSITYAKIQNISANAMLMRGTTAGAIQEVILGEAQLPMRLVGGGISNVALGSGLSLSGSVLSATGANGTLIGYQLFKSSGSYTKSTNKPSFVVVEVLGGGGGGGGCVASTSGANCAGGGGAGGYSLKKILASALGASETVTVGAGGTAGANTGGTGGTGGTSSFGAFSSAVGGGGGLGAAASYSGGACRTGGLGGASSGGDLNIQGASGQSGTSFWTSSANSFAAGGVGGCSSRGGSGRGACAQGGSSVSTATNGDGQSGSGGGGAAGTNMAAVAGATGGSGLVIVWEYA